MRSYAGAVCDVCPFWAKLVPPHPSSAVSSLAPRVFATRKLIDGILGLGAEIAKEAEVGDTILASSLGIILTIGLVAPSGVRVKVRLVPDKSYC